MKNLVWFAMLLRMTMHSTLVIFPKWAVILICADKLACVRAILVLAGLGSHFDLRRQVSMCASNLGVGWFPDEEKAVLDYLNDKYYKLKK